MHYNPRIDVGQNSGGGTFYEVNDALQYGSIGYSIYPSLSVEFSLSVCRRAQNV